MLEIVKDAAMAVKSVDVLVAEPPRSMYAYICG